MNVREAIRQSLEVIRGNKVRSFLTTLGINFGVGSLIAIAVIGLSVRQSVNRELNRFGSSLFWVSVNYQVYAEGEPYQQLDERDIRFFRQSPGLKAGSSIFNTRSEAASPRRRETITVQGVERDYFEIFSLNLGKGRLFLPQEVAARRKVCILGLDIAAALFGHEDPLGREIKLLGTTFTVIGIKAKMEQGLLNDGTDDSTIFVPLEFVARRNWGGGIKNYWVYFLKFETITEMEGAAVRVGNYLENKYGRLRDQPRFRIRKMDFFISTVTRILGTITTLIMILAAISLLVGGLGIMNIMLVSVTERTREIGLRMAVGAHRRDILLQFIIEAITLCLIGGGLGVVFGVTVAIVVCRIMEIDFIFSLLAVIGALGISSLIGLLFGIYPAYKASLLTPIEALRREN